MMIGSVIGLLSTIFIFFESSDNLKLTNESISIFRDSRRRDCLSEDLYIIVTILASCEQPITVEFLKPWLERGADPNFIRGKPTSLTSMILKNFALQDSQIFELLQNHKAKFSVFPHLVNSNKSGYIKNVVLQCRHGLDIDEIINLPQSGHDLIIRVCLNSSMAGNSNFRMIFYLVMVKGLRPSEKTVMEAIKLNRPDCVRLFLRLLRDPIDLYLLQMNSLSIEMKLVIIEALNRNVIPDKLNYFRE